jgi:hypothetical protein
MPGGGSGRAAAALLGAAALEAAMPGGCKRTAGGGGRFPAGWGGVCFTSPEGDSGFPQPAWGHTVASSGTGRWQVLHVFTTTLL